MADILFSVPSAGDKTLANFYEVVGKDLKDVHHELLNEIARAITERGWIQPVDAVVARLVDQGGFAADKVKNAIAELAQRRLLTIDETGNRFAGFLGSISFTPTPHRAHLETGVDVYTHGGMELLAVNSTLLKPVDVFTKCPISGKDIRLKIANEQIIDTNIQGISGFLAEWDGQTPLASVAANSPLFASDDDLEKWEKQNASVKGLALPGDLLLWVGMQAAQKLGALRFKLIGHHD
ncbi:MAG: organomercurial lyase [Myxococcota bacterium]